MKFRYLPTAEEMPIRVKEAKDYILTLDGAKHVFENVMLACVQSVQVYDPELTKGAKGRAANRILHKLDVNQDGVLELEQSEIDLLKQLFGEQTVVRPEHLRTFYFYADQIPK